MRPSRCLDCSSLMHHAPRAFLRPFLTFRLHSLLVSGADAYLQIEHGADSDLYAMLRQAMMARRAPLTLDGLSFAGRPPGLRSRAPSESTLQTEISESLSDALR